MPLLPIPLSLYVHIPFCAYRCRYCNFTFETGWSPSLMTRTLDTLVAEAEALRQQGEADGLQWKIRTLYLGGGTPGVVPADLMASLLHRLEDVLDYKTGDLVEATIEANPENVTPETLSAWSQSGLNRLSLGVQTFDSARLALLGRWCDSETNHHALDLVVTHWKGRWSADLMTGLPGQGDLAPQRWVDLRGDLKALLAYQPGHVSLYSLIVEPQTDLAILLAGGGLKVASEPMADQLWLRARQTLLDDGFEWYEISNFAHPGHRSVHNQAYWRLDPWAGLGPGAEGTLPQRDSTGQLRPLRTRNPKLFPWLTGQRNQEVLSAPDFALEHFLAGWRTADGLVSGRFESLFGSDSRLGPDRLDGTARLLLNQHLAVLAGLENLKFQQSWPTETNSKSTIVP